MSYDDSLYNDEYMDDLELNYNAKFEHLELKYRHKILPETASSFTTHTTPPPTSPTSPTSVDYSNIHSSRKQDPTSIIFTSSTNRELNLSSTPYEPSITHMKLTSIPTHGFQQTISPVVNTTYYQQHDDALYPTSIPTTNTFEQGSYVAYNAAYEGVDENVSNNTTYDNN